MKLKELQSLLQDIKPFSTPKVKYEQYATSVHIASTILHIVHNTYNEVEGRAILDLGCGTGRLTISAALLGCSYVLGVDIDLDALEIFKENLSYYDDLPVDVVLSNVASLVNAPISVDTVIMNPPFGSRKSGADIEFLECALMCAKTSVYSIHKTSTRDFIRAWVARNFTNVRCEVLSVMRVYCVLSRENTKDVVVDFWRFAKTDQNLQLHNR